MRNLNKIIIRGARENNLKNLSLEIPKHQITVFTGVSGSGKSSLVLDTIAAKSRRELNDTVPTFVPQYLPKYGRPHVDAIENLPIAIVIDQKKPAQNSRSTVGTYTDIAALLRLLFSRVGQPFVGYSDTFSFNHPEGSCPRCSGLGEIRELDIHKLVDFDKSLNDEDTIHYIAFGKGGWRWIRYAYSGLFDLDKKIRDYSPEELDLFLNSPQIRLKNPPANWPKTAKYEGLIPRMYRSIINSEEGLLHAAVLNPMLRMGTCPDCDGTRLNKRVLTCKITGSQGQALNIAEASALSIRRLNKWVQSIASPLAVDLKTAISARLTALEEIGLGYLSLDRAVGTLSGGEAQRCKIAKYINSSLSDVLYVLDEPSTGLHNRDIELMKHSVQRLRDAGNTVLLVEHHPEMIRIADHIVDMGPGAGIDGGHIAFEGTYDELLRSNTDTGRLLNDQAAPTITKTTEAPSETTKGASGTFTLRSATLHNLKDITVELPLGVFGVVCGVAGSGKSSLMESFRRAYPKPEDIVYISQKNIGVSLRSTPATYMDVATDIRKMFAKAHHLKEQDFTFNGRGGCPVCGGKGVIVSEMAFMDSIETVCDACGGLRYNKEVLQYKLQAQEPTPSPSPREGGLVSSAADVKNRNEDKLSKDGSNQTPLPWGGDGGGFLGAELSKDGSNQTPLPWGGDGGGFLGGLLKYGSNQTPLPWGGDGGGFLTIAQVFDLSVRLASDFFRGTVVEEKLRPLMRVGLGYLHLNQALSTLSGGELQRLKMASYLSEKGRIFVFDEPTDGLHLKDVRRIVDLFHELVAEGNTVYVIEHHTEVIRAADYVVELGPGAGEDGGRLLFAGTPAGLMRCPQSVTAPYL